MDNNYYHTLIAVADDCPASAAVEPEARGGKRTVAVEQYEMLAGRPYVFTQEDVLFEVWLKRRNGLPPTPEETLRLRAEFFAKDQPCLRSSPLPKKYGGGLAFDENGRVALCAVESAEYRQLRDGGQVKVLKAFRSKRT